MKNKKTQSEQSGERSEHTATPWLDWREAIGMWQVKISSANDSITHIFYCRNKSEAEELFRAVNSYEVLLSAARLGYDLAKVDYDDVIENVSSQVVRDAAFTVMDKFRKAIAKAEGKENE